MHRTFLSALSLCAPLWLGGLAAGEAAIRDGGELRTFTITGEMAVPAAHPAAALPQAVRAQGLVALPAALAPAGAEPVLSRDGGAVRVAVTRSVVVHAGDALAAGAFAAASGGAARPTGYRGLWYVDFADGAAALAALPALEAAGAAPEPDLRRQRVRRGVGPDPLLASQWHLDAANVPAAWATTTGAGIAIAVVDDCLEVLHPDLAANCPPVASLLHRNFNGGPLGENDPSPPVASDGSTADAHGTACAGLVAAVRGNLLGGAGVAPAARMFGLRLIAGPSSDSDEATAITWRMRAAADPAHISTNSWGPADASPAASYTGPGSLVRAALADAVANGRGGRGGIICFAAGNGGNGGSSGDSSNYDGYANSREVLAVGGVFIDGTDATYADWGANVAISAPTGKAPPMAGENLVTTDVSGAGGAVAGDYRTDFNGTSGACPQVAGVAALMLSANPSLGWRDAKEILMRSAARNEPADDEWAFNSAGLHFHHAVGAGLVDAAAAVGMAGAWSALPAETSTSVAAGGLPASIPDGSGTLSVSFTVDAAMRCEHVQLRVAIDHAARGQLRIVLTSPSGMRSLLAAPHSWDSQPFPSAGWTYLTLRHWGEDSAGTWTATIADPVAAVAGQLKQAQLIIWGTPGGFVPTSAAGITRVELSEHGAAIGEASAAPFAVSYRDLPAGRHHLVARIERGAQISMESLVIDVPGARPRITSRPQPTARAGTAYAAAAAASAPVGTLVWSLPVAPAGMTIGSDGAIAWTPPADLAGPGGVHHVPVVVRAAIQRDGRTLGIDDQWFQIAVHAAADPG